MPILPSARSFSSRAVGALGGATLLLQLLSLPAAAHSQFVFPDPNDPNFNNCGPAISIMSSCVSKDVRFATVTDHTSQAACACYTSATWAPTVFDNAYQACLRYYVTAIPSVYAQLTNDIGTGSLCASIGTVDPAAAAAAVPGPQTPPPAAAVVTAQLPTTPAGPAQANGGGSGAAATPAPPTSSASAGGPKSSITATGAAAAASAAATSRAADTLVTTTQREKNQSQTGSAATTLASGASVGAAAASGNAAAHFADRVRDLLFFPFFGGIT